MGLVAIVGTLAFGQSLLDVNAASVDELDALPGVGPAKARALVLWRDSEGPCVELDDLLAVPGWGPGTLAAIRPRIACGSREADPSRGPAAVELDGPALHADRIDLNAAGPFRLAELPGISLARAEDIVAHRQQNGPFASCADLVQLPGIGPATVALVEARCTTTPTGQKPKP